MAFWGWNRAWLDPGFRAWNLEEYLSGIRVPVLLVQGGDDDYGTLAQLDAIESGCPAPVQRLVLADCGHAPHRDQAERTLAAMAGLTAVYLLLFPRPMEKELIVAPAWVLDTAGPAGRPGLQYVPSKGRA